MMPSWTLMHKGMTAEHLGLIPSFLDRDDPRPAKEQFNENYIAGWRPFKGFTKGDNHELQYPGDNPLKPVAVTHLRDEVIILYPYSWVAIFQPDGSFEACRMD